MVNFINHYVSDIKMEATNYCLVTRYGPWTSRQRKGLIKFCISSQLENDKKARLR